MVDTSSLSTYTREMKIDSCLQKLSKLSEMRVNTSSFTTYTRERKIDNCLQNLSKLSTRQQPGPNQTTARPKQLHQI